MYDIFTQNTKNQFTSITKVVIILL